MTKTFIDVQIEDHIATVTMDRPPVNAFSPEFQQEFIATFDALGDTPEVRAIVLTGRGKVFCAGADIKARAGKVFDRGERGTHNRNTRETFHCVLECRKPVVAALNGPALGGGLAIAASADILVTSTNGSLGLPEIDVGLLGGARHSMRLFGHSLTRRMVLTGYRVPGPELYRLGIVEACVAPEELMDCANRLARQVADKSPAASRLAKATLNAIEDMSLRDGYRYEQTMTAQLSEHTDSKEAIRAVTEKRPPQFAD